MPPKKSNVLKWVLIGIGACFMLFVIGAIGLGLFVAHKAKQAGLDPDLIKRSPALAAAKLMVAANPDVEMVTADEGKQEMTVRDKKTGKVYTMSFEDAKSGKFTMKEDGKATLTVGGKAKVPSWVPDYPGSDPQGAFSAQGEDRCGWDIHFQDQGLQRQGGQILPGSVQGVRAERDQQYYEPKRPIDGRNAGRAGRFTQAQRDGNSGR
jgi:hypothetical protein